MAEIEKKSLECPSCGAHLQLENRFVKLVVCDYCGENLFVYDESVDPRGKTAKLTQAPSKLKVGDKIEIKGQKYNILGRLRLGYEDGYWDEWFLAADNGGVLWLQEDEGNLCTFKKEKILTSVPNPEEVQVGQTLNANDKNLFVIERGEAEILGSEGQLAFRVTPGKTFKYIDGNCQGQIYSVEYYPDEIELTSGEALDYTDIKIIS